MKPSLTLALAMSVLLSLPASARTIYNVYCGDVPALRSAIENANIDGDDSELRLGTGCDYLITDLDNSDTTGNNGLPTVDNDGVFTIYGNGATIRRDNNLTCLINDNDDTSEEFRMFRVADASSVVIRDLTVKDFCSTGDGGAILGGSDNIFSITNSLFEDNKADGNGGVIKSPRQEVVVRASVFRGNESKFDGGAIEASRLTLDVEGSLFENNHSRNNGGAARGSTPIFLIRNSTFRTNRADGDSGALHGSSGGEIIVIGSTFEGNSAYYGGGAIRDPGSPINILNSTFVNNQAALNGGGAIRVYDDQTLTISNSTFVNNVDANGNAFSFLGSTPIVRVRNSILSNVGNVCAATTQFSAGSDNLISDASCNPASDVGFNLGSPAGLDAQLADNGGPTQTLALLPGSNAIDAVSDCTAASAGANSGFSDGDPVNVDQRLAPRSDGQCDIGAFEFGAVPPVSGSVAPLPVPHLPHWLLALMSALVALIGLSASRRFWV